MLVEVIGPNICNGNLSDVLKAYKEASNLKEFIIKHYSEKDIMLQLLDVPEFANTYANTAMIIFRDVVAHQKFIITNITHENDVELDDNTLKVMYEGAEHLVSLYHLPQMFRIVASKYFPNDKTVKGLSLFDSNNSILYLHDTIGSTATIRKVIYNLCKRNNTKYYNDIISYTENVLNEGLVFESKSPPKLKANTLDFNIYRVDNGKVLIDRVIIKANSNLDELIRIGTNSECISRNYNVVTSDEIRYLVTKYVHNKYPDISDAKLANNIIYTALRNTDISIDNYKTIIDNYLDE